MKKWFCLLLGLYTVSAYALLTEPVTDNAHINVPIALNNVTRVGVMGGRIRQTIHAYVGQKNTAYTMQADSESGNIFITPEAHKNFTLMLKTERGDYYTVTFHPKVMQPETILLVPQFYEAESLQQAPIATPYETAITTLMRAMVSGTILQQYAMSHVAGGVARFSAYATLQPVTVYQGANYIGAIYQLTNTSETFLTLRESQFQGPNVLAVALVAHRLPPRGATWVYEVMGNAHE